MRIFIFQPIGNHHSLDPCKRYKTERFSYYFIITMAKLHGFARPMDLITEFDGSDEDVVPRPKPKYARQLAMEGEESRMPDPPVENKTKEDWPDSYDITVTVSTTSRLYEKYKWNEERIHRLEALIARFARMSSDSSDQVVAGICSLNGDQMDMFDSLKKGFLGRVCNMKMHSYENFSTFLNRKISKIDNAWDDFSDFLGN